MIKGLCRRTEKICFHWVLIGCGKFNLMAHPFFFFFFFFFFQPKINVNCTLSTYVWSGMISLEIKSLASSDILWNSSALKSHLPSVILAIVSVSLLPRNGDKPESLEQKEW